MAGLIANLLAGSRALAAQAKGAEVAGKNLANLNTVGYARQRISMGSVAMVRTQQGTESSGVVARDLQSLRSRFLDQAVLRETSNGGTAKVRADVLQQAQNALGEGLDRAEDSTEINGTDAPRGGVQAALTSFFTGFQALAASPRDASVRQAVLSAGNQLTTALNAADTRLGQLQADTQEEMVRDMETANGVLRAIASLNVAIAKAENGGVGQAPALRDQRQLRLEELAGYLSFKVTPEVSAAGDALTVEIEDAVGGTVPLLKGGNLYAPLNFDGTNFSVGTPPVTAALGAGSLEAQRTLRTGEVQMVRDQLAALASEVATAVNGAYNPTGLTGDFFTTPPSGGILQVNGAITATSLKATDGALAGANEIARAVAAVSGRTFSQASGDAVDGTLNQYYTAAVTGLGHSVADAISGLEVQDLVMATVVDRREDLSGVSMDEEAADLLRYQRAFEASARFVNLMDELLNVVVNQMGAR